PPRRAPNTPCAARPPRVSLSPGAASNGQLAEDGAGPHDPPMPRPPRDCAPGIHHVGTGDAGAGIVFRHDLDYPTWIRLLVATTARYGWTTIIVVAMPTHWHAI